MDYRKIFADLLIEFEFLKKILEKEHEKNWMRGVLAIIEKLDICLNKEGTSEKESLEEACDTWKTMEQGNGSFTDFYIWRDDEKERSEANKFLDSVRSKIWKIINDNNL
jgi:Zn-finger domain-containing protein